MNPAETARVFAALGHEGRLSIFRLLASAGPQGVPAGEVARRTGQLQNTASSNLGVLANAGLVSARREGRSIYYAVTHARFSEALEFATENFVEDRTGQWAAVLQRLLDTFSAADDQDREVEVEASRSHGAA